MARPGCSRSLPPAEPSRRPRLQVAWKLDGISLVPDEPTTGTVVVAACEVMDTVVPEGAVHVVVTSATAVDEFDMAIPHAFAAEPFGWRVVRGGGAIEDPGSGGPDDDPLSACQAESMAPE